MGNDTVTETVTVDGVPVWLLGVVCSVAFLGIIYTCLILVFYVIKQNDKILKMTSPNINIVILLAIIIAFASVSLLGIDSSMVSLGTMSSLLQASSYVISISFTVIYGSIFAKCWRVFLIFKNLNQHGKLTRDEHLLLGVFLFILLDLAILLPWNLVDPIKCAHKSVDTVFDADSINDVTIQIDDCRSRFQPLWISLIYIYKLVILITGLYFTRQTRHVTLPSLKDTTSVYVIVYTIIVLSLTSLPVALAQHTSTKVKFATASIAIMVILFATLTLLFLPKLVLVYRNQAKSQDSLRFLFTESMKKTQDALRTCAPALCCGSRDDDKYAQDVLTNEIDTLKQTIKQKEATIRELTDRLYFGAEKFQEYLTTPKNNNHQHILQAMHRKHMAQRARSHHHGNQEIHVNDELYIEQSHPDYIVELENGDCIDGRDRVLREISVQEDPRDHMFEDEGIYSSDSQQQGACYSRDHNKSLDTTRDPYRSRDVSCEMYNMPQGIDPRLADTPSSRVNLNLDISDNSSENIVTSQIHAPSSPSRDHTPSPNEDSAIDNNSPSNESSERDFNENTDREHYSHSLSDNKVVLNNCDKRNQHVTSAYQHETRAYHHKHNLLDKRNKLDKYKKDGNVNSTSRDSRAKCDNQHYDVGRSGIDVDAMETEVSYQGTRYGVPTHHRLPNQGEPYQTLKINGVSVSQI